MTITDYMWAGCWMAIGGIAGIGIVGITAFFLKRNYETPNEKKWKKKKGLGGL